MLLVTVAEIPDEVANATDESWERFKTDAKSAVDDLGETVERGWKEIVK